MTFFCPTESQVRAQVLALLPRGRAWQTNEGGPRPGSVGAFDEDAFTEAFSTTDRRTSVLWEYWAAFSNVAWYLQQRLCALRLEFWCATHNETHPEWMTEYGLPDACDPFPDLCVKVAAIGGTRCEYYAAIVARMGWTITCIENVVSCGSRVGFSYAGKAKSGSTINLAMLKVIVHLEESPAYTTVGRFLASRAGRLRAGRRQSCGPDLSPLECLMARIVHAEIKIVYEVNNGT